MDTLPWPQQQQQQRQQRQPAPSGAQLPWIPPPSVFGISAEGAATYWDAQVRPPVPPAVSQQQQQRQQHQGLYSVAHQRRPSGWPTPQELPLPSAFPMPPSLLPYPRYYAWAPPPPTQQQQQQHQRVVRVTEHVSHPMMTSPADVSVALSDEVEYTERESYGAYGSDVGSEGSDWSTCSSCPECARVREERQSARTPVKANTVPTVRRRLQEQQHHQPQQQRPVPVRHHRGPVAQPQRFVRDGRRSTSSRPTPKPAVSRYQRHPEELPHPQSVPHMTSSLPHMLNSNTSSPPRSSPDTATLASERLEAAADRAERMVAEIEALYRHLRAGYDALDQRPNSRVHQESAAALPAPSLLPVSADVEAAPAQSDVGGATRRPTAVPTKAPSAASTPVVLPQRSQSPATAPSAGPAAELRAELLRLESQWRRLEELRMGPERAGQLSLKTSGDAAKRGAALSDTTGSATATQGNTLSGMASSVNSSVESAPTIATMTSGSRISPLDGDSVRRLIRERKAALGVV